MEKTNIDTYLYSVISKNYGNGIRIPPLINELVNEVPKILQQKNLLCKLIPSGSYSSKTVIRYKSDIDFLAVFDMNSKQSNLAFTADFRWIFYLNEILSDGLFQKFDIDGYFDTPAFKIRSLEYPRLWIDITPAITTTGINMLNREKLLETTVDYLIPGKDKNSLLPTNPYLHQENVKKINKITNMGYSNLAILFKMFKYCKNIPMSSFSIEVLVYDWLCGCINTDEISVWDFQKLMKSEDLTPTKDITSMSSCIIELMFEFIHYLDKAISEKYLFFLFNPSIFSPFLEGSHFFFSCQEDQIITRNIFRDEFTELSKSESLKEWQNFLGDNIF